MLDEKDIRFLREIFSSYNYIMTTAQLDAERLFYRDIQRMLEAGVIEKVKRGYYHWVEGYGDSEVTIAFSPMPFFVWKRHYFTTVTATAALLNGTLRLIRMFRGIVLILTIHL